MDDMWSAVGVEAAWQVTDLVTGRSLGEHTHSFLPIASLSKVVLALVVHRLAERGQLNLATPVTLHPDGRTRGTTGISAMQDPVTISLRDAAYLALTISDNAAGDALWDALPAGAVDNELAELSLEHIHVREPIRDLYDRLEGSHAATALDSPTTNTATPADLTQLLNLIWTDQAATPTSCATIRNLMTRQVWNTRLAPAFPAPDIIVAGKTGTAAGLRHEMGVITYPGDRHYAAAILTHSLLPHPHHGTDTTIGEAARRAILQLRRTP